MSCEFCEPYRQKIIDGENGFCAITNTGELIVFPKDECVDSVKIKIKHCPMCGRDFSKEEKQHHALDKIICPIFSKMDLQRWIEEKKKKQNLERWMIEYDQHLNRMLEAKNHSGSCRITF